MKESAQESNLVAVYCCFKENSERDTIFIEGELFL